MAVLPIITLSSPNKDVLRKKAHRVTDFGDKLQQLVDDMVDTMLDAPGVGLAAPQVGVPLRLIVVRLSDDERGKEEYGAQAGVLYVLANPEVVKHSKETEEGVEACLSIPNYFGDVERFLSMTIKGLDRHGKEIRVKPSGWLARVFQHEMDHLDGRLYIDIAKDVWEAHPDRPEQDEEKPGRLSK